MANVGSAAAGKTLIGAGNGASPTYASIGTNSGLTTHGVVISEGNGAFVAASPGTTGQVLTSNGNGSDPTFQTNPGLTAATKITTFTSSGTWTKSTNPPAVWIEVIAFSGGGGGGSGRKGVSTSSGGGAGGACAGIYLNSPASVYSPTETVTIGGTSNGGIAQTADLNNGNPGATPNGTSFGNMLTPPLIAAPGGVATTAVGQACLIATPYYAISWTSPTQVGGAGSGRNTAGFSALTRAYLFASAGGGGGGYDLVTPRSGGTGGDFLKLDNTTVILAGGTAGIESGNINGGDGNIPLTTGGILTGGSGGGGGGGPSVGTVAGNGGNGAIPGGGGGGGSGGISTVANSGAGGTGARGQVIVIEHF